MRKLLLALLAAFALTGAVAQEAFPDIPAGHWAGEAVSRIADLGIVIGFPDGTFRGNESFTRYQAALVVSRLLDVIQSDMDAMKAMTDEDIASLRNALQELASDVAAQGVRLDAVEGQVAQLSDDVAANTARIEEIANAGMDQSVLDDLRNQIASLRVAADTAAAQAAAAEELARGADARSRQNADAIADINRLLAMLNQDVEDLKNRPVGGGDTSGLADQVARNTNDIANLREFVILLRRDQVALRDRVAALEAADAEQNARIDDLDARLTKVEEDLLVVSGSIGLTYSVGRLSGSEVPFDVDRIFGLNNDRDMGPSIFGGNAADLNDDGDSTDAGERAQERQDITSRDGNITPSVTLNIGFNTSRNGAGSSNAFNSFESVITLSLKKAVDLTDTDGNLFDGYVFAVDSFTARFDPIGAAPLTFQYGQDIMVELTPYILDFDDGLLVDSAVGGGDVAVGDVDGFVATIGAPDFLAFLNPTLTAVYGSEHGTADDRYYRAIRGTVSPLQGDTFSLTLGGTFAQHAFNAGENGDAAGDNITTTVYGVDGQIGISFLDIDFAYNVSSTTPGAIPGTAITGDEASTSMAYVRLNADVSGVPVLNSFSANYRDIPGIWAGMADPGNYVFDLDQAGFKVEAGLSLFIIDLGAYFDSYATSTAGNVTAFGVDVSAELFRGFALTGFYSQVSIDGTVADDVGGEERDGSGYLTGFGVGLTHDGAAANALIPNLNLEIAYEMLGAGFNETHILAAADYELAISILTLTPYVSYESYNDADAASDDTVEIKAGTGLETEALDIFLKPSLMAAVNYRTNAHTDTGATDYTASEFQWSVGLMLNEFLFDNSTLTAKYGSYTGTNMSLLTSGGVGQIDEGDNATDIGRGDANNGATQATTGYEIIWNYYDLQFAYGSYTDSITGAGAASDTTAGDRETGGQYFRIKYTVTF